MPDYTREKILDAIENLMSKLGYQKTTINDIAQAAGVSRRTIYIYFPNKEKIALATVDRIVTRLLEKLEQLVNSKDDPIERLRNMLITRIMFRFDSIRNYHHSLDDLLRSIRSSYLARRQCYFEAEMQIFARLLAEGNQNGIFNVFDTLKTSEMLITATNALLPYNLSTQELGTRKSVLEKISFLSSLLIRGLLS